MKDFSNLLLESFIYVYALFTIQYINDIFLLCDKNIQLY